MIKSLTALAIQQIQLTGNPGDKVWCFCRNGPWFLSNSPNHPTSGHIVCVSFLLLSKSSLLFLCWNHPCVPILALKDVNVFPFSSNFFSPLIFSGFLLCLHFFLSLAWQRRNHFVHILKGISRTPVRTTHYPHISHNTIRLLCSISSSLFIPHKINRKMPLPTVPSIEEERQYNNKITY